MLKLIQKAFIASLLVAAPAAMAMAPAPQPLKPWVQQAAQIKIKTMTMDIDISITNTSTVADVKNTIHAVEGIPVDIQVIHPLLTSWRSLWLINKIGSQLDDQTNIKQVMNTFNTNRFGLYLRLAQPHQ